MRDHMASTRSQAEHHAKDGPATGPGQEALNAAAEAAMERELSDAEFLGLVLPPAGTHLKLVDSSSALVKRGTIDLQEIAANRVKLKIHVVTVWPLPNMDETDIVDVAPNGDVTITQDGDTHKLTQTEKASGASNRIAFKNEKKKTMSFAWDIAAQVMTIVTPKATLKFGKG